MDETWYFLAISCHSNRYWHNYIYGQCLSWLSWFQWVLWRLQDPMDYAASRGLEWADKGKVDPFCMKW